LRKEPKVCPLDRNLFEQNEIPSANLTEFAQEISKAVYNCDILGETGYKAKLVGRIRIVRMFAGPRKGLKKQAERRAT
jgi:hypothetical protein